MAKQWTKEEKLKIINESKDVNIKEIAFKYDINVSTLSRWKREFYQYGSDTLEWGKGSQSKSDIKKRFKSAPFKANYREEDIKNMNRSELEEIAKFNLLLQKFKLSNKKG